MGQQYHSQLYDHPVMSLWSIWYFNARFRNKLIIHVLSQVKVSKCDKLLWFDQGLISHRLCYDCDTWLHNYLGSRLCFDNITLTSHGVMASQINDNLTLCPTAYSGQQHQISAKLPLWVENLLRQVDSPEKEPVIWQWFPRHHQRMGSYLTLINVMFPNRTHWRMLVS